MHRGTPAKKFVRNDESKTNITILIKKKNIKSITTGLIAPVILNLPETQLRSVSFAVFSRIIFDPSHEPALERCANPSGSTSEKKRKGGNKKENSNGRKGRIEKMTNKRNATPAFRLITPPLPTMEHPTVDLYAHEPTLTIKRDNAASGARSLDSNDHTAGRPPW